MSKKLQSKKSKKTKYASPRYRSRPSKGWDKSKPKKRSDRKKLSKRCGSKCFLSPKDLKYPICSKSGDCAIQCSGLVAAKARSAQHKRTDVYQKADRMLKRHCGI